MEQRSCIIMEDTLIKEIIVVEGKDDITAVKRAVKAECIATGGFALTPATLERIRAAQARRGVIILTDPDYAGEKIRRRISEAVPGCRHAFLPKEEALSEDDIGVENASPESIRAALTKARAEECAATDTFSWSDLFAHGLVGRPDAAERRNRVGQRLGIGYANGRQFLRRLNRYGVTREEFLQAVKGEEKAE